MTIDLAFTDPDGTAYELLSVVPDVAVQTSGEGPSEFGRPTYNTDARGYCAIHTPTGSEPANPDWAWAGWDAAISATSIVIDAAAFSFTLLAAAPTAAKPQVIAPICLLTNATFSGAA